MLRKEKTIQKDRRQGWVNLRGLVAEFHLVHLDNCCWYGQYLGESSLLLSAACPSQLSQKPDQHLTFYGLWEFVAQNCLYISFLQLWSSVLLIYSPIVSMRSLETTEKVGGCFLIRHHCIRRQDFRDFSQRNAYDYIFTRRNQWHYLFFSF